MHSSAPEGRLEQLKSFGAYRAELLRFLDGTSPDDGVLYRAGIALSEAVRNHGWSAEHILVALHASGVQAEWASESYGRAARERDRRYTAAINLLMQSCFGEITPTRTVTDGDGRSWTVFLVREGRRHDPARERPRLNWLCCATDGDRRYITPVPSEWLSLSDDALLAAIDRAPPDHRGAR